MSINNKFFSLVFFLLICSSAATAQAVRSPFSAFGVGEPYGNALIHNQGMGGIGVSHPQYWFLNNQNPALLVYNTVTVFQAGLSGEQRRISADTLNEQNTGGNLSYLVTAFPIMRHPSGGQTKWTTSIGLMPFTAVDYRVEYEDYTRDVNGEVIDTLIARETGSGGLNQFYWSNGIRLTKSLSLGIKAAYIFGPIKKSFINRTTNPRQPVPYEISVVDKTSMNDFLITPAIAFSKDSLGPRYNYRFSAGATYTLAGNLNARRRAEIVRFDRNGTVLEGDTLFTNGGNVRIPGALTAGISISRINKWVLGTEFSYQDWSNFESLNRDNEGLGQSWRVAVGGEITPDVLSFDNFLKRVTYRVGGSYETYPFLVNGAQLRDFGINFGFSLPAGRSSLDFAFKVGRRGERSENILEENYFRVHFGITFNDQWFIKRKFD